MYSNALTGVTSSCSVVSMPASAAARYANTVLLVTQPVNVNQASRSRQRTRFAQLLEALAVTEEHEPNVRVPPRDDHRLGHVDHQLGRS